MLFAIQRGDVMVVNELATSAAYRLLKENKDGWIPLHDAAFCGQKECMKILLKGMTPPKAFLFGPKHVAAPFDPEIYSKRCHFLKDIFPIPDRSLVFYLPSFFHSSSGFCRQAYLAGADSSAPLCVS